MPERTKRTICDVCLHAIGRVNPLVGTEASTYAVLDGVDGGTNIYERVTGKCDWCEERIMDPTGMARDVLRPPHELRLT